MQIPSSIRIRSLGEDICELGPGSTACKTWSEQVELRSSSSCFSRSQQPVPWVRETSSAEYATVSSSLSKISSVLVLRPECKAPSAIADARSPQETHIILVCARWYCTGTLTTVSSSIAQSKTRSALRRNSRPTVICEKGRQLVRASRGRGEDPRRPLGRIGGSPRLACRS